MKILCIGNSFSQDATRYLEEISGNTFFVRNLYIPGCSLETHRNNIINGNRAYELQENAQKIDTVSINEELIKEKWDRITLQQVSHLSGKAETYEPWFSSIYNYIKRTAPDAEIALHRTWAYDDKSTHPGFFEYNNDRKYMFERIVSVTNAVSQKYNIPIIKVGDAIEKIRDLKEFSPSDGIININRDGFHLSYDYGRYAAGLVFYKFFNNKLPDSIPFFPETCDRLLIEKIYKIVASI